MYVSCKTSYNTARFLCHTYVDTYASGLEFVLNYSSKLFFHCRDAARTFYIPFKEYSRDTYFSEVAVLSSIWSLYRLLSNSDGIFCYSQVRFSDIHSREQWHIAAPFKGSLYPRLFLLNTYCSLQYCILLICYEH